MATLAGNEPQTLRGMRVEDLVPESLRRKHEALRRDYMNAPHARPMGRQAGNAFDLLRGDGTTIEVDVQLTPCAYAGEAAVVAVVRDLRTQALLGGEEAQRADTARSSFLATMSHEIRTPLNAIMGMAQLMQIDSPMERQRERLKGIEDASGHLLAIVNDVLDLAQIESGHLTQNRETFDITDVVGRSIAMVADRARLKHLALTHAIDAGVPRAMVGDARRIEQILVNLLSNAVKFTPAGQVDVHVGCREVASDGLQLRVEVRDSGIGIGREQLPNLFKPFRQLDQSAARRYGGTGLGLAISRHLARAMGGDCSVDSVLGKGSRFWFTVLVEPGRDSRLVGLDELVDPAYDPAEVAEALRGRRLLVVEDDRVNMIILVELLRALGAAAIDEAEDGQQAVEAAANGRYDLVFMDMQLPGIDGLEATRRLRSLPDFRSVPIVALTANVLAADVARCLDAGMDAHLPKPVVKNDLARALLRWLGGESPSGGRATAARAPRPLPWRR
jgi:signal transduction histidine kinase/CheY-like chemotaxis protein